MAQIKQPPVTVKDQVASPILEKKYAVGTELRAHEPPSTRKIAVIVNHGMGQQVPFETLELVARALWNNEPEATRQPIVTRRVRLGVQDKPEEKELPRVEVRLTGEHGSVEAHLYEAYWAPLTEGKVNIRQVISFLLGAGWSGVRNASSGGFRRWMFGDWQNIRLRRIPLVLSFLGAILLVISLTVINAMIVAAAASNAIGSSSTWPPAGQLGVLTRDLFLVVVSAIAIFIGTVVLPGITRLGFWMRIGWVLVFAGLAGIVGPGFFVCWHLSFRTSLPFSNAGPWAWAAVFPWHSPVPHLFQSRLLVIVLWGLAIGASALARNVIVEYVGDVAAYVAFHTVSVFWEVRQAIQELATGVARAVYRARTDNGKDFLYEKLIVVGHSLGSVIAYDVLNRLVIEDEFMDPRHRMEVATRTSLFLTFGSPLDKTAFIFRTQQDINSAVREANSAAVQPTIREYQYRPQRWVNIWSHSDWVSGSLEYYDDWRPPQQGGNKRVMNYLDRDANAPLIAHTQYWKNDLFADILYASATGGRQPAAVQPPQRLRTLRAFIWAQPVNPVNSAYRPV